MGAYVIYFTIIICVTSVMGGLIALLWAVPDFQDTTTVFTIIGTTSGGLVGFLGGLSVADKVKKVLSKTEKPE